MTNNEYMLLSHPQENKEVGEKITKELEKCVAAIAKIGEKYPKSGIGDTATDECIADRFYQILHFDQHFE